uniref:Uncharacterized protein n=1 Tax=viral metagenome TaxID=1070528 RepID=A0A6C0BDY7_9ZZZZ
MSFKLFSDINDIDNSLIRVKKPYCLYRRHIFEIYYGEKNYQFLLQTPEIMMSYGYQKSNTNSISMDIVFRSGVFVKKINSIIDSVEQKLKRKYNDLFNDKQKFHVVFENKIRLKNHDASSITVFNENNSQIALENISRDDKISVILQIDKIIVYDKFYIAYLKLVQIKKMSCGITQCLFAKSIPPPPPLPPPPPPLPHLIKCDDECNELPEKYKKMLEMGVPLQAVKHKMTMDGVQPKPQTNTVKRTTHEKQTVVDKCIRAPSLDEIVGALKNLKNVKTNIA